MNYIKIDLPLQDKVIPDLKVGDRVLLNGFVYTARDAAHKRMYDEYYLNNSFPFDLNGQTIYYVGPCPSKPNEIIGSAGPTTSGRMDKYTPLILNNGIKGMMGKGNRNQEVVESIKENQAIYFGVIGGIGALLKECIKKVDVIAYEEFGTEAIRRLLIKDFPCIVAIDSLGRNIYEIEYKKYRL